jgi:PAS domain S-box-containing protein
MKRKMEAVVPGTPLDNLSREELRQQLEMYALVLDSIHNGVVVVDPDGYVVYFNRPYGQFIGVEPSEQIGRHVTEVIENSRMHIVVKTGKPEINVAQRIKGQDMVVQRIPIWKNGKVIAALGQVMFKSVADVNKLARKLDLLESKVKLYEEELYSLRSTRYTFDSIVGVSESIATLKKEAVKAANTHLPILITGESGTGKEMFAQAIHHASPRRIYPLIRINCAAIPKDLLESELFGYEKGAFTGANTEGKPGKLELGNHGTVFLDEIGDLPLEMQPKLLRVLEEKELEHIGGKSPIKSDFRLVAASNQNLEEAIDEGKFRKDLFYRLNVIRLRIPPLRERKEDLAPIALQLLKDLAADTPFPEIKIDPQAERALTGYDWPGNIRELFNILSRVTCFLEKDTIYVHDLPIFLRNIPMRGEIFPGALLGQKVESAEREAIINALSAAENNKARAAAALGIHRTLLYKKMKKYRIEL